MFEEVKDLVATAEKASESAVRVDCTEHASETIHRTACYNAHHKAATAWRDVWTYAIKAEKREDLITEAYRRGSDTPTQIVDEQLKAEGA